MLNIKDIVIKINQGISYEEAEKLIRENVEYHTKAALKAAAEKAEGLCVYGQNKEPEDTGKYISSYYNPNGPDEEYYIDKQSILTAYPLENIK